MMEEEWQQLHFSRLPVCGREKELEILTNAWKSIRSGSSSFKGVLIEGPSGLGKTSLLTLFRKQVAAAEEDDDTCASTFVCMGKNEESAFDNPLAALVQALGDLVGQLLYEDEENERNDGLPRTNKPVNAATVRTKTGPTKISWKELARQELSVKDISLLAGYYPTIAQLLQEQTEPDEDDEVEVAIVSAASAIVESSAMSTVPAGASFSRQRASFPGQRRSFPGQRRSFSAISSPSAEVNAFPRRRRRGRSRASFSSTQSSTTTPPPPHALFSDTAGRDDFALSLTSSWCRFVVALKSFFKMVCGRRCVVLIQDDLQWADSSLLTLLVDIFEAEDTRNLLFLGAHRPLQQQSQQDSSEPQHLLSRTLSSSSVASRAPDPSTIAKLNEMHNTAKHMTNLCMENLTAEAVLQMVATLTDREPQHCLDFAQLLHQKTQGNPFAILQLLRALECKDLVSCSEGEWVWDLERIEDHVGSTNGVLEEEATQDVVVDNLTHFPADVQLALTTAAFLGPSHFHTSTLQCVLSSVSEDEEASAVESGEQEEGEFDGLAHRLDYAVREGVLERVDDSLGQYKFAHDQIQASATALLSQHGLERATLHHHVGTALADSLGPIAPKTEADYEDLQEQRPSEQELSSFERYRTICLATHHLNQAYHMDQSQGNGYCDLAKLHLEAAKASFQHAGFHHAARHLENGLVLLESQDGWRNHYQLTLQMKTMFAQMLSCIGEIDRSFAVVDEVVQNARSLADRTGVLRCKIQCLLQEERYQEAISLGRQAIRALGFSFPSPGFLKMVALKNLVEIRFRLRQHTPESIANIPQAKFPNVQAASQFYMMLNEAGILWGDLATTSCCVTFVVLTALKHGMSDHPSLATTMVGLLHAELHEYDLADQYSQKALSLAERNGRNLSQFSLCVFGVNPFFLMHWKQPLPQCLDVALQAKQGVMERGAVHDFFVSFIAYVLLYLQCGLDLRPLREDVIRMHQMLEDFRQNAHASLYGCMCQFVMNMMGDCKNPIELSGEFMDQESSLCSFKSNNNRRAIQVMTIFRTILAYHFDDLPLAHKLSKRLFVNEKEEGPSPILPSRYMFQGLICFALAKKREGCKRWQLVRAGLGYLRILKRMVCKGCINVHHLYMLLRAERATLNKNSDVVQVSFDEAIVAAGKTGFTHNQALGNELAGAYFHQQGDDHWASIYLNRAQSLYLTWGAFGKAHQLKAKYPSVIDAQMTQHASSLLLRAKTHLDDVVNSMQSVKDLSADFGLARSSAETLDVVPG